MIFDSYHSSYQDELEREPLISLLMAGSPSLRRYGRRRLLRLALRHPIWALRELRFVATRR